MGTNAKQKQKNIEGLEEGKTACQPVLLDNRLVVSTLKIQIIERTILVLLYIRKR